MYTLVRFATMQACRGGGTYLLRELPTKRIISVDRELNSEINGILQLSEGSPQNSKGPQQDCEAGVASCGHTERSSSPLTVMGAGRRKAENDPLL